MKNEEQLDLIENDNFDENHFGSNEFQKTSFLMDFLNYAERAELSKTDLKVLCAILEIAEYDNANKRVFFFKIDKNAIADKIHMAVPNVHRSVKKLLGSGSAWNSVLIQDKDNKELYRLSFDY